LVKSAKPRLSDYRLFRLGPNGRFAGVDEFQAEADEAAIRRALDAGYPYGCEVWAGPRFVGQFAGPRKAPNAGRSAS
jgi:hypothetical protein